MDDMLWITYTGSLEPYETYTVIRIRFKIRD